jgi:hypothetical protein
MDIAVEGVADFRDKAGPRSKRRGMIAPAGGRALAAQTGEFSVAPELFDASVLGAQKAAAAEFLRNIGGTLHGELVEGAVRKR